MGNLDNNAAPTRALGSYVRFLTRIFGSVGIASFVAACVNTPLDPPSHLSDVDWDAPANDYDFEFFLRYAGQPVWERNRTVHERGVERFLYASHIDAVHFAFDSGVPGVGVQSRRLGCTRPSVGSALSPFCIYDSLLFRTGESSSARLVDRNYLPETIVAGFESGQTTEIQRLAPTLPTGRLMGARHIEDLLRHVRFVVGHFSRIKVALEVRDQWAKPITENEYVDLLRRRRQFENDQRREPSQAEVPRVVRLESPWHGQRFFVIEDSTSNATCQIESLRTIANEVAPAELQPGFSTARPGAWDHSVYSYQSHREGTVTYMWFNAPVSASNNAVPVASDPVLYTARAMVEGSTNSSRPLEEQIRSAGLSNKDYLQYRYFGGLDRKVARGVLGCDVTAAPTNLTGQYNF